MMSAFAEILETIGQKPVKKRGITNHAVLNEAFSYDKPSSFSRGMRIDLNGLTILLISGTASIDEDGVERARRATFVRRCGAHFRTSPDCWPAKAAPGTISCAPRATCATLSAITTPSTRSGRRFTRNRDLIRCPRSTGIQAILCRPELLVEIEAIAMFRTERTSGEQGVGAMRKGSCRSRSACWQLEPRAAVGAERRRVRVRQASAGTAAGPDRGAVRRRAAGLEAVREV